MTEDFECPVIKRFRVKYKIIQEREFWCKTEEQIKEIINERNGAEVLEIEEIAE